MIETTSRVFLAPPTPDQLALAAGDRFAFTSQDGRWSRGEVLELNAKRLRVRVESVDGLPALKPVEMEFGAGTGWPVTFGAEAPETPVVASLAAVQADGAEAAETAVVGRGEAIERRYRTVLADPCWQYENWSEKGKAKNADRHYSCMTVSQIAALPVADVLTEDAALFLWITGPFLMDAPRVATAWGFPDYSGIAFTWAKQSPSGNSWAFGPGYWTRKSSEFCLLFTRDKKPTRRDKGVPELVVAPRREHSRKPDEVHERIERLIDGPRLELFARERREGWTTLGDHLTGNHLADDLRALAMQPSLELMER